MSWVDAVYLMSVTSLPNQLDSEVSAQDQVSVESSSAVRRVPQVQSLLVPK